MKSTFLHFITRGTNVPRLVMILAFVVVCAFFGTSFASEKVILSSPSSSTSSSFPFTLEERFEAPKLLIKIPLALKEVQAYHQRFKEAEKCIIDSLGEYALALSLPDEDPDKLSLIEAAEDALGSAQAKAKVASKAIKMVLTGYNDFINAKEEEEEEQPFKRQRH